MTTPRDIIAQALWRLDPYSDPSGPNDYHRSNADALSAELHAACLLLPDGTETTEEWAVLCATGIELCDGEEHARRQLACWYRGDPTAHVAHRTAHFEPWQPAPEEQP